MAIVKVYNRDGSECGELDTSRFVFNNDKITSESQAFDVDLYPYVKIKGIYFINDGSVWNWDLSSTQNAVLNRMYMSYRFKENEDYSSAEIWKNNKIQSIDNVIDNVKNEVSLKNYRANNLSIGGYSYRFIDKKSTPYYIRDNTTILNKKNNEVFYWGFYPSSRLLFDNTCKIVNEENNNKKVKIDRMGYELKVTYYNGNKEEKIEHFPWTKNTKITFRKKTPKMIINENDYMKTDMEINITHKTEGNISYEWYELKNNYYEISGGKNPGVLCYMKGFEINNDYEYSYYTLYITENISSIIFNNTEFYIAETNRGVSGKFEQLKWEEDNEEKNYEKIFTYTYYNNNISLDDYWYYFDKNYDEYYYWPAVADSVIGFDYPVGMLGVGVKEKLSYELHSPYNRSANNSFIINTRKKEGENIEKKTKVKIKLNSLFYYYDSGFEVYGSKAYNAVFQAYWTPETYCYGQFASFNLFKKNENKDYSPKKEKIPMESVTFSQNGMGFLGTNYGGNYCFPLEDLDYYKKYFNFDFLEENIEINDDETINIKTDFSDFCLKKNQDWGCVIALYAGLKVEETFGLSVMLS